MNPVLEKVNILPLSSTALNRGGGLSHYLSPTYNAVLSSLPRQFNNHSHLSSPSPGNAHEDQLNDS